MSRFPPSGATSPPPPHAPRPPFLPLASAFAARILCRNPGSSRSPRTHSAPLPPALTFASASDPTKDLTQALLDAGSHTTDLTATFTPTGTSDTYTAAAVDVEVAKANIVIVADSYKKSYADANPTLTDTIYADLGPATGIDLTTGKDYSTETDPGTGKPYEVYEQLDSTDPASVAYTSALGSAASPAPSPTNSPKWVATTSTRHKLVMPVPVPPVTSS